MPKGILIPAQPDRQIELVDLVEEADPQMLVGGYVEVLSITEPLASLFINEEGRLKDLPFNPRATYLTMVHNPSLMFRGIMILGAALLTGPPDKAGDIQDVPQELVELLINTKRFKYVVQTADDPHAWNGNQRRYDDLLSAYEGAIDLAHRWFAVERVKVVPA